MYSAHEVRICPTAFCCGSARDHRESPQTIAFGSRISANLEHIACPKRDDFSSNRYRALISCWSMIFSEDRYPLFGIML
jgi:hypothetical protein